MTENENKNEAPQKPKRKKRIIVCTCADEDFCWMHPKDTYSLDPDGPWGPP